MCGSGTLPIEAALMAGNIAPGLLRRRFGFMGWAGHDRALWDTLCREAVAAQGWPSGRPVAIGFDGEARAVDYARRNLEAAGLSRRVHVERRLLENLVPPKGPDIPPGLVVVNPPYGHRLGEKSEVEGLYLLLGRMLRERFSGWKAAVLTLDRELGFAVGLRAHRVHRLYNGALKVFLLSFEVP
jgi:23S rRNA (guanine2445-N2)-methyltransferase / 23S rRNA (guanine2069-N7)-methyltransferase